MIRRMADGYLSPARICQTVSEHIASLNPAGRRVLVLVPDDTRSGPLPLLLGAVREALLSGGATAVDVLIALGTHPPMPPARIDALLGSTEAGRAPMRVFNHAWEHPETFAALGTVTAEEVAGISGGLLREEVEVRINRMVLDYDHVLVCGPVFPHEVVGYSGGNKYFFPGVSAREMIDVSHWLGALITSYEIIGTLGTTPVRALIDRAAAMIPTPRSALCYVVSPQDPAQLHGVFAGPVEQAWSQAAELSSRVHVRYEERAYRTVLSVIPPMYDEIWVAAKGMYKLEPVVADGGEVILYAPHVKEFSRTHGAALAEVGYHVRDYFLKQGERFAEVPRGVLAHSTHLRGAGSYDLESGEERPRIRVTLATGIPEAECRAMGLGYLDPAGIDPADYAGREAEGVLLVPKAGETLYRLRGESSGAAATVRSSSMQPSTARAAQGGDPA
jgi:nickel-dependent lactate racemase